MVQPIGLLLRNPYLLSFLTLYAVLLGALHTVEGFGLVLPLFVLLIMGIGFSALAWWTTSRAMPPSLPVKHPRAESGLLGIYLVFLVGYLTWGANAIEGALKAPAAKALIILTVKLALFVALPLILFSAVWKYQDFPQFLTPIFPNSFLFLGLRSPTSESGLTGRDDILIADQIQLRRPPHASYPSCAAIARTVAKISGDIFSPLF